MKTRLIVVTCLFLALSGMGLAVLPETLPGFIYYETTTYPGFPRFQATDNSAAVFRADGTYSQIYFRHNDGGFASVGPIRLGQPGSGTYSYRKISDSSAELNFDGRPGVVEFFPGSTTSGNLFDPTKSRTDLNIPSRQFRLVPLSALSPLVNCSNRSVVRTGGTVYTGFVVNGPDVRVVLVRAVGPGLAPFGVSGYLRDPALRLREPNGLVRSTNDNWSDENATSIQRTSAAVGAFALPGGSLDAAIIIPLTAGAYIAEASSPDPADSGSVLIEVYLLP